MKIDNSFMAPQQLTVRHFLLCGWSELTGDFHVYWFVSLTFCNRWVRAKAVISQCWRKLSHCLFLVLDFKLFIGQLSHCPFLQFWNKFCVFVVVGGWDDRQHRLPGPFPAQCDRDFPPQNLPALHPAASPRQWYHPGHTAHTHQQQFKGLYI